MNEQASPKAFSLSAFLIAAATVTVFFVVVDVVWVMLASGGARAREVGIAQVVRMPSLHFGLDFFRLLPDSWSHYYELSSLSAVLPFLAVALPSSLAVGGIVIAVLLPISWLFARASSSGDTGREMGERWRTYGTFLLAASLASLLGRRTEAWWPEGTTLVGLLLGGVLVLGCFLSVRLLWRVLAGTFAIWRTAAAGLLALVVIHTVVDLFAGSKPAPRIGAPNVLLISIDSLRADHLDSYGYFRETSPNLTRLAEEGVRFETVIAPTSWTLPSHTTLLTSMPPNQHGVIIDETALSVSATNLAEIFSEGGYRTAAFVSGPYMRAEYGHYQGFDLYNDYAAVKVLAGDLVGEISSPMLTRLVKDYLGEWDRSERERPFFIFLHLFDVHFDYIPPAPYDTMFDPDYEGDMDGTNIWWSQDINPEMDPRDLEHLLALYDGEIRYTDEHIGMILSTLEDMGVFDDTLIAVTADHGEEFLEHGDRAHRFTLYEEVLDVPLILRYPRRLPAATTVGRPVRTMDIGATLLSLAGIEPSAGAWVSNRGKLYEALDLTQLLPGASRMVPDFVSFGDLHGQLISARTATHKLLARDNEGVLEFYDLIADPGEHNNLVGKSDLVGPLYEQLMLWREQTTGSVSRSMRADSHHTRVLRSLGYLR